MRWAAQMEKNLFFFDFTPSPLRGEGWDEGGIYELKEPLTLPSPARGEGDCKKMPSISLLWTRVVKRLNSADPGNKPDGEGSANRPLRFFWC